MTNTFAYQFTVSEQNQIAVALEERCLVLETRVRSLQTLSETDSSKKLELRVARDEFYTACLAYTKVCNREHFEGRKLEDSK